MPRGQLPAVYRSALVNLAVSSPRGNLKDLKFIADRDGRPEHINSLGSREEPENMLPCYSLLPRPPLLPRASRDDVFVVLSRATTATNEEEES